MIARTEALVLRISPFSRTSHMVTWITRDQGRLVTAIKGALRPKSTFLGQYDLFYTCELLYYIRSRSGTHIASDCSPINIRARFRQDWRACACASYVCDVVSRVSVAGDHQADLYQLTSEALDVLADGGGATRRTLFAFETSLMNILGMRPQLDLCAGCGNTVTADQRLLFVAQSGGVLCARCETRSRGDGLRLDSGVLSILKRWQAATDLRSALAVEVTPEQVIAIRRSLGVFLTYHIDISLDSRRIAVELASP